jgi:hypothetical protein
MANTDIHNIMDALPVIPPAVYSSTQVGAIIDTDGAEGLEFLIQSGVMTTGSFVPKIEDGDDSGLSDAADVATALLIGTIADATFAAADDGVVKKIGVVNHKRYVRLTLTDNGTADGLIGALAVKSPKNQKAIS